MCFTNSKYTSISTLKESMTFINWVRLKVMKILKQVGEHLQDIIFQWEDKDIFLKVIFRICHTLKTFVCAFQTQIRELEVKHTSHKRQRASRNWQ